MAKVIRLAELDASEVPEKLRVDCYFDLAEHPFAHARLLTESKSVIDVLGRIGEYARGWLAAKVKDMCRPGSGVHEAAEPALAVPCSGCFRVLLASGAEFRPSFVVGVPDGSPRHTLCLDHGARFLGGVAYLDQGDIYIGRDTVVEPGAGIKGPAIVMERNVIRQGAYLRENVMLGAGSGESAFRGELKNVVMLDEADFPHAAYLGDSLCGRRSHFGSGATAANFGLFQALREPHEQTNAVITIDGVRYDLGRVKVGAVLGDGVQVGCNAVLAPATLLGKRSVVYALSLVDSGAYLADSLLKNKPMSRGVVEVGKVDFDRL